MHDVIPVGDGRVLTRGIIMFTKVTLITLLLFGIFTTSAWSTELNVQKQSPDQFSFLKIRDASGTVTKAYFTTSAGETFVINNVGACLLYTSDAADE